MITTNSPISEIPRITKPQIAALKKLGIETVSNLLFYFPYKYLDFSKNSKIVEIRPEETVTIQVTIKSIESRFSFKGRMSIAEALVSDDTGSMKVVWFNQGYLAKSLKKGDELFLSGTPEYYKGKFQLTNPMYEKVSDFPIHTARLVPVYHLNADIYRKTFRSLIASIIDLAGTVEDIIPEDIIKRQGLPPIDATIRWSHFPESLDQVQSAKKRLAFKEIFLNQLLAQKHKMTLAQKQSFAIPFDQEVVTSFLAKLPFELTPAQKRAVWDILQDLEKPLPMNRLVEGDVGSGKTLVAFIAALGAMQHNLQVALLAPTEILARQHFATAHTFLSGQYKIALLTNHYSKLGDDDIPKKKLQELIGEGMPGLFIGTQALLMDKVTFKDLALVIIDEQHRFGVNQRAELIQTKGKVPHLLSLTATPIPRTLQLAVYGELEISQIKTKPAGRKPIYTKLVQPNERQQAYDFIYKQVQEGRQAFVITPLIEENDTLGVKAAKTEIVALQKIFPHLKIGLLHGKLKGSEKEAVMAEFLANNYHILVSTSVVEVGVDVPNATVMVIEAAQRFGLAQLHQFRGRVGRSEHQSYCFLFTETENPEALTRLEAFTKTFDGFALAELDLQQRGFGELYGSQQSGWNFKYFNPSYTALIPKAREEAITLLTQDFSLTHYPLLQHQLHNKIIHFE